MSKRIYQLVLVHRGKSPVRGSEPGHAVLDLDDPAETDRVMARQLLGAVERAGHSRQQAHLYMLQARLLDGTGQVASGPPVLSWVVPLSEADLQVLPPEVR